MSRWILLFLLLISSPTLVFASSITTDTVAQEALDGDVNTYFTLGINYSKTFDITGSVYSFDILVADSNLTTDRTFDIKFYDSSSTLLSTISETITATGVSHKETKHITVPTNTNSFRIVNYNDYLYIYEINNISDIPTSTDPAPTINMNPFKNLIDNIFSLPLAILNTVNGKLDAMSQIIAQGIDISKWLAPIGLLGPAWVKVLNSLLAGSGIVLTVWIVKKAYSIYLQFKEGVKFW